MNNLRLEVVAAIALVIVVLLKFVRPRKEPKEKYFRCARCSTQSPHTDRTIQAWRDGKTKFFCNACHTQWLRSRPLSPAPNSSSRSGCLGVFVILVFLPVGLLLILTQA
jgi:hypothetical protein